ncbi:MAG: S8 family serine peptidase, partial [Lentisphaerae bacterium]|nr:S8 family serine peptidase [Lentisphaerota bacterium]
MRYPANLMILILLVSAVGFVSHTHGDPGTQTHYRQDHIIVRFKPRETTAFAAGWGKHALERVLRELDLPNGATLELSKFALWLRNKKARELGVDDPRELGVDFTRYFRLQLPPGMSPEECVERLKKHPLVEAVGMNPIGTGGLVPFDPQHDTQWYLQIPGPTGCINAPDAWDITTGSNSVIVAVLDTGCDTNLLEFAGRTVPGYDIIHMDDDPADDHGHGTAVAAVLCANANNGTNGAGVDWQCKLMPVKVLNEYNGGDAADWADGIDWAVSNGAKVIN